MSPHDHFTLKERETILLGINDGLTLEVIAKSLGRFRSTVCREIARNGGWENHSVAEAQTRYEKARGHSRRPRILADDQVRERVVGYIIEWHWSAEQIAGSLRHEDSPIQISYQRFIAISTATTLVFHLKSMVLAVLPKSCTIAVRRVR